MKSPAEEAKFLITLDNIWDIAARTLFTKYIIENAKGYQKLWEIDSTDQESKMISQNGGLPVPGMIYTFIYKGEELMLNDNPQNKFFDYIPLVFCMNNDREFFNGINLNMLPEGPRLDFLQSFWESYKKFFEDVERETQNDKLAMNKRFLSYIAGGNGQKMINVFNRKNSANFNYGFRRYNYESIKRLRMIEYSEWIYIPFYRPLTAFRTMPVDQIHKIYYRTK